MSVDWGSAQRAAICYEQQSATSGKKKLLCLQPFALNSGFSLHKGTINTAQRHRSRRSQLERVVKRRKGRIKEEHVLWSSCLWVTSARALDSAPALCTISGNDSGRILGKFWQKNKLIHTLSLVTSMYFSLCTCLRRKPESLTCHMPENLFSGISAAVVCQNKLLCRCQLCVCVRVMKECVVNISQTSITISSRAPDIVGGLGDNIYHQHCFIKWQKGQSLDLVSYVVKQTGTDRNSCETLLQLPRTNLYLLSVQ